MIIEKDTLFIAYNEDKLVVIQGLVHKGQAMDIGLPNKEYFYSIGGFLNRLKELEIENEVEDLESFQIYLTPPQMSGYGVVIPSQFEWVFKNDKFTIGDFVVNFNRVNNQLVVDIAYLEWQAFKDELDAPQNKTVKESLEDIWDYVKEQVDKNNLVQIK